jgi:hypothetical protein
MARRKPGSYVILGAACLSREVAAKAERSRCNFSSIPARIVTETLGLYCQQLQCSVLPSLAQHDCRSSYSYDLPLERAVGDSRMRQRDRQTRRTHEEH